MSDCMLLWIVRFEYLWLRVYLLLPQELLKARPIITYAVGIGMISLCLVLQGSYLVGSIFKLVTGAGEPLFAK